MNILIAIFSFVLLLLCLFTLLVVMVQKPKGDGGMGAALGGGSMEAAFGAETGSLLTRVTIFAVIAFFILTFALYLGNLGAREAAMADEGQNRLRGIVDESASPGSGANPDTDSALQQMLQIGEEETNDAPAQADDAAGGVAEGVEDTAEGLLSESGEAAEEAVQENTNP